MSDLLVRIARCDEAEKAKSNISHDCHRIVNSQSSDRFQLPEPWNGDIHNSQILFIASNPSYDPDEFFPDSSWSDACITRFFQHRFSNPHYQKIRYWTLIKKYASWILNTSKDDPCLLDMICITEIVHCKSKGQKGVNKACRLCSEKWLDSVIKEFKGDYVVVLGRAAQNSMPKSLPDKTLLFMPHPNARGVTDEKRKQCLNLKYLEEKSIC